MQTLTILENQVSGAGFQLEKVYEGLSEEHADFQASPAMMSPKQIALHLADCYVAVQDSAAGIEHQWGAYQAPGPSLAEAVAGMKEERAKATTAIAGCDEEKQIHLATDFMILHDAYHVGQLCTARLAIDPEWNNYSIYNM